MGEDFNSSQPIYQQMVQRICKQIVRGERAPGEKLPSVREMALQFGVNPNTVQRVYSELERMNVVETKRGQGTFVTEDVGELQQLRELLKSEAIQGFVTDMLEMGFLRDEILAGLQEHFRKEQS